jgi:mannose-P-dolichol utilization defect protein 1
LARVFTTLQEVPDKLILYGFIAGFCLNAVLAVQMVYYWNSTKSLDNKNTNAKSTAKKAVKEATSASRTSGAQASKTPSTRRRG